MTKHVRHRVPVPDTKTTINLPNTGNNATKRRSQACCVCLLWRRWAALSHHGGPARKLVEAHVQHAANRNHVVGSSIEVP